MIFVTNSPVFLPFVLVSSFASLFLRCFILPFPFLFPFYPPILFYSAFSSTNSPCFRSLQNSILPLPSLHSRAPHFFSSLPLYNVCSFFFSPTSPVPLSAACHSVSLSLSLLIYPFFLSSAIQHLAFLVHRFARLFNDSLPTS